MKKKLYYGWIMTAAAFVVIGLGTYFSINSFGIYVAPVVKDLGIPVASFTLCATIMAFMIAISGSFAGKIVDKKGIKFTAVLGALIMALGYIILGLAKSLPLFYVGYALIGVTCSILGPLLTSSFCARWFVKYRGLVNGIISAGGGLFATICAPLLAKSIVAGGYSKTYFMCLIAVAVILVVTLIFFRDKPEDMGLYPDGADAPAGKAEAKVEMPGFTLKQAVKTSGFWLVSIGFIAYMFADLAIFQTYNANIQSVGFDPILAASVVGICGLAQIPAKILYGFITDKISIKASTVIGFGFLIAAALLTVTFTPQTSKGILYLFAVLFAFGHGCWPPLFMKYVLR